ncbi:alcohol dehydrogenase [Actinomadura sp. KC216]|uniref:zinc-dependent alcohol dehydrogenase family protein n=1 Tax=Actinomadura sp. KC216 TaxID=2530370 RepID=UPI0010500159|nr:zinc-dependent alcohol dehydrogenase family protein [Actinomadura sp. KC216]TDB83003.1 alcohol dehydrogenase [Actinomadura sp. KC216]
MRAIRFERFGDPSEVLRLEELPDPAPGPGQVRVRITARPVNPSDRLFVEGRYGRRPELPSPVGFEAAGVVDDADPGAAIPTGTRVALDAAGTWQEQVIASPDDLTVLPDDLADETACQMTINPPTAILLMREAALEPGQWLVQTAGASTVAQMVTCLAVRQNVHCVNVVRGPLHTRALAALGAEVIDSSCEPIAGRIADLTRGEGAAAAFDAVGGTVGEEVARCLGDGGRLISYGLLSGRPIAVRPEDLIFRSVAVLGFWLPDQLARLHAAARGELTAAVLDALRTGVLPAPVDAQYGLDDFGGALRRATRPGRMGKVILTS